MLAVASAESPLRRRRRRSSGLGRRRRRRGRRRRHGRRRPSRRRSRRRRCRCATSKACGGARRRRSAGDRCSLRTSRPSRCLRTRGAILAPRASAAAPPRLLPAPPAPRPRTPSLYASQYHRSADPRSMGVRAQRRERLRPPVAAPRPQAQALALAGRAARRAAPLPPPHGGDAAPVRPSGSANSALARAAVPAAASAVRRRAAAAVDAAAPTSFEMHRARQGRSRLVVRVRSSPGPKLRPGARRAPRARPARQFAARRPPPGCAPQHAPPPAGQKSAARPAARDAAVRLVMPPRARLLRPLRRRHHRRGAAAGAAPHRSARRSRDRPLRARARSRRSLRGVRCSGGGAGAGGAQQQQQQQQSQPSSPRRFVVNEGQRPPESPNRFAFRSAETRRTSPPTSPPPIAPPPTPPPSMAPSCSRAARAAYGGHDLVRLTSAHAVEHNLQRVRSIRGDAPEVRPGERDRYGLVRSASMPEHVQYQHGGYRRARPVRRHGRGPGKEQARRMAEEQAVLQRRREAMEAQMRWQRDQMRDDDARVVLPGARPRSPPAAPTCGRRCRRAARSTRCYGASRAPLSSRPKRRRSHLGRAFSAAFVARDRTAAETRAGQPRRPRRTAAPRGRVRRR